MMPYLRAVFILSFLLPISILAEELPKGIESRVADLFCGPVDLIENGKIDAAIVLPFEVRRSDAEAANFLAEALSKSARFGKIDVLWYGSGLDRNRVRIFLRKGRASRADPSIVERKIVSIASGGGDIEIKYPRNADAMWAVGVFLREYCRVSFFAPSEIGTEIPRIENLRIDGGTRYFSPSFRFFNFSLGNPDSSLWARLAGMSKIPPFSHNLKRALAALKKTPNVQADFSDSSAVRHAAEFSNGFLLNRPESAGVSLGLDDTQNVPESFKVYKDGYFRGYPNYSDAVFRFVSSAAKEISRRHPSKFVGALAYLICVDSPSFRLPGNVFPMICADRSNYVFPEFREEDFCLMRGWSQSGVRLWGIYEYAYGSSYAAPREVEKYCAEALKKAGSLGAQAYYAEAYPIWAYDAKKLWILSRLADSLSLDLPGLEDEFFKGFYGGCSSAARRFFAIAGRVWSSGERAKGKAAWLSLYNGEDSISLYSESDIAEMESALREAEVLASGLGNGKISARVAELRLAFNVTKAAWRENRLSRELFVAANFLPSKIPDILKDLRGAKFDTKSALSDFFQKSSYPNAPWRTGISDKSFPEDLAALRILESGADGSGISAASLSRAEKFLKSAGVNLMRGGDFERAADLSGNFPAFWSVYSQDTRGLVAKISESAARSGRAGAEFSMCEQTGISQTFPISSGKHCMFEGWVKADCRLGAAPYATLYFHSEDGKILRRKTFVLPPSTGGKFARFALSASAPRGAVKVTAAFFAAKMQRGGRIFADDFSFFIFD